MTKVKAAEVVRRRGSRKPRALSGRATRVDGDIGLVQDVLLEEGSGGAVELDDDSRRGSNVRRSSARATMPAASESSAKAPSKHRHRRVSSSREEEERRRHRRAKREARESPAIYVYGAPKAEKRPSRTRISEVRVLGCSGDDEDYEEEDGKLSAVDEERVGPRRENRDRKEKDEKHSSGHRRRRRLTEEERAARHQSRELRESTASLSRSKSSSQRKESIQPFEFLRRTLSSTSARPDPRPTLKKSHTTSSVQNPKKSNDTSGQNPRRSVFIDMFTPAVKEEAPVKLVECLTCLSDDIPRHKSAKLKCGHRMCHSCLRRIFKLSVTDPQHMPPKCCTTDCIPLKHVDKLFDVPFKKHWNKKYQEYTTKNRIYCPSRRCGEWIKPANYHTDNGVKYGKCGRCKTKVCTLCSGKWHGNKECPRDEETNRLLETAKEAGWQRCYSCRTMVELKEGCNHMTCHCRAEFCMLCGLRWKTCACPWFNYEAIEDDRLAHMRVPAAAPLAAPGPGQGHMAPVMPAVGPHYARAPAPRPRVRRRDADLAGQMRALDLGMGPQPAYEPVADYNYEFGVGNAAPHLMNETYVRPVPQARPHMNGLYVPRGTYTPPVQLPAPPLRGGGSVAADERSAEREERSEEREAREAREERRRRRREATPRPSILAGLEGRGRGSGRVGAWRTHVGLGVTPEEGVISVVS